MPARTPPDQVLDAARACIARVGLVKTTLDDVAHEAGCSRATVYRYYSGKQQLLGALVEREARELGHVLVARARAAGTLTGATVEVITGASRALTSHRALGFVVAHEPELLLPYLAFERESAVLGAAAALVAPAFEPFLAAPRAARLAEWIARITLSYLCCPSDDLDITDAGQVRGLVDEFVLPGFLEPAGALEGVPE